MEVAGVSRAVALYDWIVSEIGAHPDGADAAEDERLGVAFALAQDQRRKPVSEPPLWVQEGRDRLARLRAAQGAGSADMDVALSAEVEPLGELIADAEAAFTDVNAGKRGRQNNDRAYELARVLAGGFRARGLAVTVGAANGASYDQHGRLPPTGDFPRMLVELYRRAGVDCADWRVPAKAARDAVNAKKPGAGPGS